MDDKIGRRIRWVLTSERQPAKRGFYTVAGTKSMKKKPYYWNGEYWVTPGHCPATGVFSWMEVDWDDD